MSLKIDQKHGEPDELYRAFLNFAKEAPKDRAVPKSLAKVAKQWDWISRATAWDKETKTKAIEKIEEAVDEKVQLEKKLIFAFTKVTDMALSIVLAGNSPEEGEKLNDAVFKLNMLTEKGQILKDLIAIKNSLIKGKDAEKISERGVVHIDLRSIAFSSDPSDMKQAQQE